MKRTTYRTLVEALKKLEAAGYTASFKFTDGKLQCLDPQKTYKHDELQITEIHRFEGESDPADMSVLFALLCSDGVKGTVVSSYGAVADVKLLEFMDKVRIMDRTVVAGK